MPVLERPLVSARARQPALDSHGRLVLRGVINSEQSGLPTKASGQIDPPQSGQSSRMDAKPTSAGPEKLSLLESIRRQSEEGKLLAEQRADREGDVDEGSGARSGIAHENSANRRSPGMIPVEKPTRMEWAKDEIEATLSQLKSLQMAGEALHRGVPPDCPSSPASLRPPLPAPGTPTAARRSAAWANSPEIPRSETRGRAVQVGTGLAWGERDEEAQRAREARDSLLDQMRALQNEAQQLL